MKKNYEVTIKAFTTVLVIGAEDTDEADERALDTANMSGWELDDADRIEVSDKDLEATRRHANHVSEAE